MLGLPAYLEKKMDQPVAIFGSGISGLGVAELLKKLNWKYDFYDRDGKEFTEKEAEKSSIVITSPGFTLDHNWIKIAEENKLSIYGEMDFASIFCENPMVAITGTNGKTTLVTLLSHLWNKLGRSSLCAGNIGTPLSKLVSEGLDPSITLFLEVSSFQAQRINLLRPNSIIWTNFSPDHLDHHPNVSEYFLAKANLLKQLDSGGNFICGSSVSA
jgi:UDP-N-acetylmuramoylalanine--D-glutamate ligase